MKRKRSLRLFNNLYLVVGKTVVFTGVFCGLFFLLNLIVNFLEPYVMSATSFCVSNLRWIMISISVVTLVVWGIFYALDYLKSRREEISES